MSTEENIPPTSHQHVSEHFGSPFSQCIVQRYLPQLAIMFVTYYDIRIIPLCTLVYKDYLIPLPSISFLFYKCESMDICLFMCLATFATQKLMNGFE